MKIASEENIGKVFFERITTFAKKYESVFFQGKEIYKIESKVYEIYPGRNAVKVIRMTEGLIEYMKEYGYVLEIIDGCAYLLEGEER